MKHKIPIGFLLLFSFWLNAQNSFHFSTKNGLKSNHVYDFEQDSNGIIWIASDQGITKYDGNNFEHLNIHDGLPNNDIWYLEAHNNKIWYLSKSNYQGYIKNDSIYKFESETGKTVFPYVYYLYGDKMHFLENVRNPDKHFLYYTISDEGMSLDFKFDKTNEKLIQILNKLNLSVAKLNLMYSEEDGKFILFSENSFHVYDHNYNKLFEFPIELPPYIDYPLVRRAQFTFRKLSKNTYLYNFKTGMCFLDIKHKKTKFYSYIELMGEERPEFSRAKIKQNLIQLSFPDHLFVFNLGFDLIDSFHFEKAKIPGYGFLDKDYNLWITHFTDGITFHPKNRLNHVKLFINKKVENISFINNQMFVGIHKNGIYRRTNDGFILYENKQNKVYQIKHYENEIFLLSGLSIKVLNDTKSEIQKKAISILDKSESLKTAKDLIFKNDQFHLISHKNYQVIDRYNFNIIEEINFEGGKTLTEHQNNIYIGASDGLFKFENGIISKPQLKNDIINIPINYMLSSNDNLFIGSDGQGVYIYNNNRITSIEETTEFGIQKIILRDGFLWIATEDGVKKIKLNYENLGKSKIVDAFYKHDGLCQNNINDIAIHNDTLYVATDIGLSFHNLNDTKYKKVPNLYIDKLSDTLTNNNKQINISFGTIEYPKQYKQNYYYRLLPTQNKWVKTKNTTISFSNLNPGNYTIEIKAINHHNKESIKKMTFYIVPAWYQTTLFKVILYIVALLSLIKLIKYIIYKYQETMLIKFQQEQRVVNLELQALRSQMNPHFIHNSLNSILYYIQRNNVEQSTIYLNKFSTLVKHFFNYNKHQNITLKRELDFIETYLHLEQLRFEDKLKYQITIDKKINPNIEYLPSMILQPIIENAVNHGIFHKQTNGFIKIRIISIDEDSYQIEIEDDGIGIEKAIALKKRTNQNYKSKSSDVLKERIQLLKESSDWNIEYRIKDLSKINNQMGTLVSLKINRPKYI